MSYGFKISKAAEPFIYEVKNFTASSAQPSDIFPFFVSLSDDFFLADGFFYIVKALPVKGNSRLCNAGVSVLSVDKGSLKLGLCENPFADDATPLEFSVYRIPVIFSLKSFCVFSL